MRYGPAYLSQQHLQALGGDGGSMFREWETNEERKGNDQEK